MLLRKISILLLLLSLTINSAKAIEYNITAIPNTNWATNTSINDNGQVVGFSAYNRTGFYWDSENGYSSLNSLLDINNDSLILPSDINNNGQILFNYNNKSSLWSFTDGMICENLPFNATAVNDNSTIIGTDRDDNLVRWDKTNGYTTLNTNGRSIWFAGDINNNGKIVGAMYGTGSYEQMEIHRAFIYDDLNGIIELETITNLQPANNPRSSAFAINNEDQIIGSNEYAINTHGVIWNNELDVSIITENLTGSIRINDINDLGTIICNTESTINNESLICYDGMNWLNIENMINDPLLEDIFELQAINNNGQILAYGKYNGEDSSLLLLTPIPEPSSIILLSCGTFLLKRRG